MSKFGMLSTILTKHGAQFTSKIVQVMCAESRITSMTTTEYHSQIIWQGEKYIVTIIFRLSHYVAEHNPD